MFLWRFLGRSHGGREKCNVGGFARTFCLKPDAEEQVLDRDMGQGHGTGRKKVEPVEDAPSWPRTGCFQEGRRGARSRGTWGSLDS